MPETQPGGVYMVGGKLVDANGQPTTKQKAAAEQNQPTAPTAADPPVTGAGNAQPERPPVESYETLSGVEFASDEAAELAAASELVASDFEGVKPSAKSGYSKADVQSIVDGRDK